MIYIFPLDLICSSDSDNDGDNEYDFLDDVQVRGSLNNFRCCLVIVQIKQYHLGQTSPIPLADFNSNRNHARPNQPGLVNISTTDMNSSNGLLNEAEDVEVNVHTPGDIIHQSIVLARLKCVLTLKTRHRSQLGDGSIGVPRA